MSITPQSIKDQEFQSKFRGYDTIEVKAYLELLAEEFFDLHELRRKQEEEFAELHEETEALKQERTALLDETREREERTEASVVQFLEKDEIIDDLQKKVESLEQTVEASEHEKALQLEAWERQEAELREEVETLKSRLDDKKSTDVEGSSEVEKLRAQVELYEGQITELKKEEVDFKTTLLAAQRFADDVRKKAQEESDSMMEQAIEEVETFRKEAEHELADLPVQIEKLQQQKTKVREDLRAVLHAYLEQIDVVPGTASPDNNEDLSELFQSIPLGDDDEIETAGIDTFREK